MTALGDEPQTGVVGDQKLYKISIKLIEHAATDGDVPSTAPQVLEPAEAEAWLKSASRHWSKLTILSSPTVVTAENRTAVLRVGGERTFTVAYDGAQPKKETVFLGTDLSVLPTDESDGLVRLPLEFKVAELQQVETKWVRVSGQRRLQKVERPIVGKQGLQTTLTFEEGQCMIVGRVVQRDARGEIQRVLLVTVERIDDQATAD